MREKVVVLGSTGYIGSYLVPMLVKHDFEVVAVSRGKSQPYIQDYAWENVQNIRLDRTKNKNFAKAIAQIKADVVIDLINFDVSETKKMVAASKDTPLSQYVYCSSIWAHGRAEILPIQPNSSKKALDNYGKDKYSSEIFLKRAYLQSGFPATIIMPGQISGAGWAIISPYGNTNVDVFKKIANGEEIFLPNFGMETLHHVHAKDVAQLFLKAIIYRNQSVGESFHAVAKKFITLYGYAKQMYAYFNQEENSNFLSWEKWCQYISNKEEAEHTYYHIARSGQFSIENARELIHYEPKYSIQETIEDTVTSYVDRGLVKRAEGTNGPTPNLL